MLVRKSPHMISLTSMKEGYTKSSDGEGMQGVVWDQEDLAARSKGGVVEEEMVNDVEEANGNRWKVIIGEGRTMIGVYRKKSILWYGTWRYIIFGNTIEVEIHEGGRLGLEGLGLE